MSKKIQFGAILMIVLCGLAACGTATPPSLTPGQAPTQPPAITVAPNNSVQNLIDQINTENGDHCDSTHSVNLGSAAQVNTGAYFWEFFVNFKERKLELATPDPNSADAWPAKLKISGCFRLYGRRNMETSAQDKYELLAETDIPCYWTRSSQQDKWIEQGNLQEVADKFADNFSWQTQDLDMTRAEFRVDDQIVCGFNLVQFINDLYDPTLQSVLPESDNNKLSDAVTEINVAQNVTTAKSSELFPYMTVSVIGEVGREGDLVGNLVSFIPSVHTNPTLNQCCQSISFAVQPVVHSAQGAFFLEIAGQQYGGQQVISQCSYELGNPIGLRANFEPGSSNHDPSFVPLTGEELKAREYKTDYMVTLSTFGSSLDHNPCTRIDTPTQQPIQFWPYTSTVTIGGGFQGALYEVWFDPDDASKK